MCQRNYAHSKPPSDEGGVTDKSVTEGEKSIKNEMISFFSPSVSLHSTAPSSEGAKNLLRTFLFALFALTQQSFNTVTEVL